MTSTVLERLCDERDEVRSAAIAIAESEDFSPEDKTFLDLQTRAEELDRRVASLNGLMEARSAADALDGRMSKSRQRQEQHTQHPQLQTRQSWGEIFVRDDAFTSYRMKGSSGIVTIDDDLQTRALPTGVADLVAAGLTGAPTQVDTTPPVAPTPLLDSVTQVQVSGNAIEYISWAVATGGAAVVAEKAAKPAVEFRPTITPDVLQNIAAYTQLTRQMIEDYSAVQSLINSELQREVARKEEAEAVAALGAATLPTATGDTLLEAIRVGVGTVQAAGYSPNAVMLNPADYAALDIAVMGATLIGPTLRQSFWGLTPVPASSQAEGTAVVGDFRTGLQHFFRNQIQLFVSDSHADTFLSNVFTLLAERRSKTAVVRPQALVEVTG